MKKRKNRAYLVTMILFTAASIVMIPGCSKKEQPESVESQVPKKEVQLPASDETYDETLNPMVPGDRLGTVGEQDQDLAEEKGIVDQGTPCQNHRYHVFPGTSQTLSFEVQLTGRNMQDFNSANLEIRDNGWAEYGIEVSISDAEVETTTVSYPVWKIDGGDFYKDVLDMGLRPTILTLENVSITWDSDGYGLITKVRGFGTAQSVGKYTVEELKQELGSDLSISYTLRDSGKTYTWEIEADSRGEDIEILKFELNLALPLEPVDMKKKSIYVWAGARGWGIKASYSRTSRKFIISGPSISSDCFEKKD